MHNYGVLYFVMVLYYYRHLENILSIFLKGELFIDALWFVVLC